MTESGLDLVTGGEPPRPERGRRRAEKPKKKRGWLKLLLLLVVLAVLAFGGLQAYGWAQDRFGAAPDYTGEGSGEVVVQVESGASWRSVSYDLEEQDVVKSAKAFYEEALDDPDQAVLQAGSYLMKEQMSAEAAYRALTTEIVKADARIAVPEGARVDAIVASIAEKTEIPQADLEAALADPAAIGLPAIAAGNPEGYLYPATYTVDPGETAVSLLSKMVAKGLEVATSLDIEGRAAALGYTTEQVLTVASILEYEVSNDDFARGARVIYNRLDMGMPLQMDSTVHYVSGRSGDVFTTDEERAADSPYNTYKYPGLPPGPIGSPGEAAIEAALNPEAGDWVYFVADPDTGETTFATTYSEHQQNCRDAGFSC
ncbi:endolytic transglycosylase MltG [Aeromicrobium alkaliterrae]|uniref:Endolytic murein transglycosylase n=1 Tax=Aeromicrobium alkaliterrae TaxID=302168 RepID=A0ABP4VN01_9ACTN